jgi:hypothetical protein
MKMRFQTTTKLNVFWLVFLLFATTLACSLGARPTITNNDQLSEADYKTACKEMPVSELTKNADGEKGQLVKITGKILVYEETQGDDFITRIIIAVEDEIFILPSGQLPVYVRHLGRIDSFINDTVTVYGEVYGNDDYESPQIKKKSLPRVDAKYIEKVP